MALCVNLSLSSTSGTQFHVSLRRTATRSILFDVLCVDVVKGNEGVDSLLRDEVPAKEPRYDSMKNCGLKSKSLCVVNAQSRRLRKFRARKSLMWLRKSTDLTSLRIESCVACEIIRLDMGVKTADDDLRT